MMHIIEVFPHKSADAWVSGNGLVPTAFCFVMRGQTLDATVIHKWPGDVRDLLLQDKGYVFVKDRTGIGPALGQASQSHSTDRRLDGSEVTQGDIKSAVVVANK